MTKRTGDRDENPQIGSAAELIERLRQNSDVLAIVCYGSGMCPEAADTDLCVIVAQRPEGLESVHFWAGDGPVDLNIRTLEEFESCCVVPLLDEILRSGRVLYERRPGMLEGLRSRPAEQTRALSSGDVAFMRHGHGHYLAKLDFYRERDPLYCRVLLCGATHWLLQAYATVRGMPYRGEKAVLKTMAADDRGLIADFETLSGEETLDERVEALRRATEKVLSPIGGSWRRGEVLFFSTSRDEAFDQTEWAAFFRGLMGDAGSSG